MPVEQWSGVINKGPRIDEMRRNAQYPKGGMALTLIELGTVAVPVADPANEAAAAWSPPVYVLPFDCFYLQVDHTPGADTLGFEVIAQVSEFDSQSDDSVWFDLYEKTGAGLARWAAQMATTAATKIAFESPVVGKFMRFKTWTPGADQSGSHTVVKILLDKRST